MPINLPGQSRLGGRLPKLSTEGCGYPQEGGQLVSHETPRLRLVPRCRRVGPAFRRGQWEGWQNTGDGVGPHSAVSWPQTHRTGMRSDFWPPVHVGAATPGHRFSCWVSVRISRTAHARVPVGRRATPQQLGSRWSGRGTSGPASHTPLAGLPKGGVANANTLTEHRITVPTFIRSRRRRGIKELVAWMRSNRTGWS